MEIALSEEGQILIWLWTECEIKGLTECGLGSRGNTGM